MWEKVLKRIYRILSMPQPDSIHALTKGTNFGPESFFVSLCEASLDRVAKHEVTSITWYKERGGHLGHLTLRHPVGVCLRGWGLEREFLVVKVSSTSFCSGSRGTWTRERRRMK